MIHQSKSYLEFLRRSKNKHGVHSPFVFNLITKCFNDKTKHPEYKILKQYKKTLKQDKSEINMTDFGQGSRVFKGTSRKTSRVAKQAGMKLKRQKLLFRLASYLETINNLELGTSLGISTAALALGTKKGKVLTVEGCPNTAKKAEGLFEEFNLNNIQLEQNTFIDFLSTPSQDKYDLIFIDGDHNGERTLKYFEKLLAFTHNDTVIVFDDIYWSKGMTEAWEKIIKNEKVTVSIDTFQWGLVFFRKEQLKQHFIIRV